MATLPPEVLDTLLGDRTVDDRTRTLLSLLATSPSGTDDDDEDLDNDGAQRALRRERARQRLDELRAEIVELRHRNATLAAALGACAACWGESPMCPACRGAGRPGALPPDPTLYDAVVAPAAASLTDQTHPTSDQTHPTSEGAKHVRSDLRRGHLRGPQ